MVVLLDPDGKAMQSQNYLQNMYFGMLILNYSIPPTLNAFEFTKNL